MKAICSVLISGYLFLTSIYAVDYTSVQNGEWNNDATWDAAGYPDGSDDNVTIDGETVTASVDVVCGSLTMTSGTLTCSGSPTITAYNTWNTSGGTFNAGGSTVVLHGGAYTITTGGATFSNLTFNTTVSGSTKTLADDFTVNGTLTIRASNSSAANYISASGTPTITLNGNYYKHDCNLNSGLTSTNITVSLTNDIDQTLTQLEASGKFSAVINLAKAGTGKLLLGSDFSFGGGLTIPSGQVLDTQGHIVTFGSTFSNVDATTFLVGTNVIFSGYSYTITTGQITFSNLTFSSISGYVKTLADDFTVNGTLEVTAASSGSASYVYPSGTRTITLNGDYNQHTLYFTSCFGNTNLTVSLTNGIDQTFSCEDGNFGAVINFAKAGTGKLVLGSDFPFGSGLIIPSDQVLDSQGHNVTFGNTFSNVNATTFIVGTNVTFSGGSSYTITTGQIAFSNLTLIPGSGKTLTLADDFTVNGTLEFHGGSSGTAAWVVPSGTRAIALLGDYNQHTCYDLTSYFGNSGLTLIMQGASDQMFTRTLGKFNANYNVNKSSGSAILSNVSNGMTIATGSSIIITNGTLDINGTNLTVATAGNFIVYSNGTFQWRGDESVTVPDLRAGSTVCFKGADSPVTVTNWSYKNLTIDAPGKTFLWTDGATYTVAEQFTVNGADGNLLILHSTSDDVQWNLNLTTLEGIAQYVSVKDSNAGGGEAVRDPLLKSVNEGNNINWFITPPPRTILTFF